jgi:hypothetical protein
VWVLSKIADCAPARANRGFGTDKKRIRTKTTVIDKSNKGVGLLFLQGQLCNNGGRDLSRHV